LYRTLLGNRTWDFVFCPPAALGRTPMTGKSKIFQKKNIVQKTCFTRFRQFPRKKNFWGKIFSNAIRQVTARGSLYIYYTACF
jgi:hypothetical protein